MFNTAALRALCSPAAEAIAEKTRIDMMVEMGHQAADEIEQLRERVEELELKIDAYAHEAKYPK